MATDRRPMSALVARPGGYQLATGGRQGPGAQGPGHPRQVLPVGRKRGIASRTSGGQSILDSVTTCVLECIWRAPGRVVVSPFWTPLLPYVRENCEIYSGFHPKELVGTVDTQWTVASDSVDCRVFNLTRAACRPTTGHVQTRNSTLIPRPVKSSSRTTATVVAPLSGL